MKKVELEMINRLLILCSRLNLSSSASSEIKAILESYVNWNKLLRRAGKEGVGPLLYKNLRHYKNIAPENIMKGLKNFYIKNSMRNTIRFEKLKPFLKSIQKSRLRTALIKGTRLLETIYKDWGLRQLYDYDFLVHPNEIYKLRLILVKHGFWREVHTKLAPDKALKKTEWIMQQGFKESDLKVDFSFNFPGIGVPLSLNKDIWESMHTLKIQGADVMVLSLEYEFCILCLHAQMHSYERLIWLVDIAEMSVRDELDWETVLHLCKMYEIHAVVFYALSLVNGLWPDTVSPKIVERYKPGRFQRKLLSLMWPLDAVVERSHHSVIPFHAPSVFLLFSWKRFLGKLKVIFSIVAPPVSHLAHQYNLPKKSIKVYYIYIGRLLKPFVLFFKLLLRMN